MYFLALLLLSTPASPLTIQGVVARHLQARGGYEKIAALRTVIYRGVYREGETIMPGAAMALMRPYYKLVGDPERPSTEFAEGYDGSAWEFYGDPGIALRTVGPASAASRHGAAIDGDLVDAASKGTTLSLEGIELIDGREAYKIRVRMADGFEQEEFIDSQSFLLAATRKVAPVHAFGEAVRSESLFGDYRAVEGVLFAHAIQEVDIATHKLLNEVTWTSITANIDLSPAVFSPPSFKRTPLQQFLEQLFEERSDVEAVMWTYRDFRRTHPDIATDAAVQVIGYQMLKMDSQGSAITLLERNAADYPKSPGAAFGLGRAYKAAGRMEQASNEFQRALTLDPNHARARDALKTVSH